ncbi:hypothetical protein GOODEAATRI_020859 [Goodea atripinnis]|uniref:Uncharacterized protein n=1 Tax=Goodea atripinnis TaxID=208336 RepID=A0ABV0PQB8_9TELE
MTESTQKWFRRRKSQPSSIFNSVLGHKSYRKTVCTKVKIAPDRIQDSGPSRKTLRVAVAQEVGVHPVTSGLLVQTPALSVSVVVSLGKTLHPPWLLMVVRRLGGASVWIERSNIPLSVCKTF